MFFYCVRLQDFELSFANLLQKLGVLALIDEESNFPKGTDESMLSKLHSSHEVCYDSFLYGLQTYMPEVTALHLGRNKFLESHFV